MHKKTLSPLVTVVGVIAATSLFLVLINVSYEEHSIPEKDVPQQDIAQAPPSPPADYPQDTQPAAAPENVLPEEPPKENEPDIAQLVSALAAPLRYVKVVPGAPRLEQGKKAHASYTVTVTTHPPDIEDLFGLHEYTFETGEDFSDMTALCQVIEEGSQKGTVELPKSKLVFEELYAISGLIDLRNKMEDTQGDKLGNKLGDKVEIFIQGYADGQATDWVRPLLDGRYAYHAIDVYPPLASGSQEPAVFLQNPVTIKIPSTYENRNLPDLRAQFIKDAILDPFLKACVNEQIPVKILKGYAFPNPDNPLQRKVDVYINFY